MKYHCPIAPRHCVYLGCYCRGPTSYGQIDPVDGDCVGADLVEEVPLKKLCCAGEGERIGLCR